MSNTKVRPLFLNLLSAAIWEKHTDWVTTDILHSGNFGFHHPGKQRLKEKTRGLWFSYKTTIQRARKFGVIAPVHSRILPVKKLINHLKIGFK